MHDQVPDNAGNSGEVTIHADSKKVAKILARVLGTSTAKAKRSASDRRAVANRTAARRKASKKARKDRRKNRA